MFDPSDSLLVGVNKDFLSDSYSNPFYSIPLQYLPRNIDDMLRWANHFLFRFEFYRSALGRVANYFITELSLECENPKDKEKYESAFKAIKWKEELANAGVNIISAGNEFATITPGFDRFLECPKCHKAIAISKLDDYEFDKGVFKRTCSDKNCRYKGEFRVKDITSKDLKRIHITHYPATNVHVRYESTTGESEYFWEMPAEYINARKKKNNKFYSKKTPKIIFDCIFAKKPLLVQFSDNTFIHLRVPTPAAVSSGGKAIPPCIYMFDSFFMLKVLERFNEVICFEDINPFRVISMASSGGGEINPILQMDASEWSAAVDAMITAQRQDPATYHKFPFPIEYQQLKGEGNKLAPVDIIKYSMERILTALNIPQELFAMNLSAQGQAIAPTLRLFENAWSPLVDSYDQLVQHWADAFAKILDLAPATVRLLPTTLADDLQKQQNLMNLMQANAISRTDVLKMFSLDYEDQTKKRMQEDEIQKRLQEEQQEKDQIIQQNSASLFNNQQQQGGPNAGGGGTGMDASTPDQVLQKAQDLAQQLISQPPATIREELQKLKAQGATSLYSATKTALDELRSQSKSQGLQQGKQQGQQQ